ncbi:uncharacterized protein TNCV_3751091 [Trichonephila clavipes]|uniref:Uncharacterized protein n=1 Tax=Trichonephila clavipes TaxID=2585209 RepID=A0A8X6UP67_TRICX|nr:uncharacterized protein TNCV_3751091 [Trichonephila clavipes]
MREPSLDDATNEMPLTLGDLRVFIGVAAKMQQNETTNKTKTHFTCRNCGGGDRGVAIYRPFGEVSLSLNRTVTCMVLKANDRRTSCPCHDEFRGPRSDYVRQVYDPPLPAASLITKLPKYSRCENAAAERAGTRYYQFNCQTSNGNFKLLAVNIFLLPNRSFFFPLSL